MNQTDENYRLNIFKRIIVSITCAGFLYFIWATIYSMIAFSVMFYQTSAFSIVSIALLILTYFGVLAFALLFIWKKLQGEVLTLFVKISLTIVSVFIISTICFAIYGSLDWRDSSSIAMPWLLVSFFGLFLICLIYIWKWFKNRLRLISTICLATVVAVTSATLLGPIVYENSVPEILINEGEEIPLYQYQPFIENTLAESLDEPSTLELQGNLPRLDGSTAHYPLYAAFARATYPESEGNYKVYDDDSIVRCSKTSGAFENLLNGTADVVFLMGVSDDQLSQAEARGLQLKMTPIGKEAFVFFVNKRNSIENLSVQNVKDIYSGNISNWREVGGPNNKIRAFLRTKNSGSQTMLEEIMGDIPLFEAPEEDYFDMMKEMYSAVAYKDYKNAIGFSFRYYINDMIGEDMVRLLSIDSVSPDRENIANGKYPFSLDFYAITIDREPRSDEDRIRMENAQKLIDWILSTQGQTLVNKTGYIPLN